MERRPPDTTHAARLYIDRDPIRSLNAIREFEGTLDAFREREVLRARAAGLGWPEIGDALNITRQSARERYRHLDHILNEDDSDPESDLGLECFRGPGGTWTASGGGYIDEHGTLVEVFDLSESPGDGGARTSLPDLMIQHVPDRFYLSPRAAAGILERADRKGRELPMMLREYLEELAAEG